MKRRFQFGLEDYEFARFAAIQLGELTPEAYLQTLLNTLFHEDRENIIRVTNRITVLKNARCPHDVCILDIGSMMVTLDISNEVWQLAKEGYQDYCHPDPLDFLYGLLNMALLEARYHYDVLADISSAQTWRPYWLQNWLGQLETELEDIEGFEEDYDDEFPF